MFGQSQPNLVWTLKHAQSWPDTLHPDFSTWVLQWCPSNHKCCSLRVLHLLLEYICLAKLEVSCLKCPCMHPKSIFLNAHWDLDYLYLMWFHLDDQRLQHYKSFLQDHIVSSKSWPITCTYCLGPIFSQPMVLHCLVHSRSAIVWGVSLIKVSCEAFFLLNFQEKTKPLT